GRTPVPLVLFLELLGQREAFAPLDLVEHAVLAPVALAPPDVERPLPVEAEVGGRLRGAYVWRHVVPVERGQAVSTQPVAGRAGLLRAGRGQTHAAVVPVEEAGRGGRRRILLEPPLHDVRLGLAVPYQHQVLGHRHAVRLPAARTPAGGVSATGGGG